MALREFIYTKADGTSSERVVIPLREPTEMMLAIDVSEFSEEEKEAYSKAVEEAQEIFKQMIKEIGLSGNYRNFKKEGIQRITDGE